MLNSRKCLTGIILGLSLPTCLYAETIGVFFDPSIEPIKFAANDIKASIEAKGNTVEMLALNTLTSTYANKKVIIALHTNTTVTDRLQEQAGVAPTGLGEQAYALVTTSQNQTSHWVIGGDINGTMYGGLQLAENIKFDGFAGPYNTKESPLVLKRGIKLNLPFDEKSPTYESNSKGTSYQKAIPNVWDMKFWAEWFDEMARHRYNFVSVWNNHPFTSLIKLDDYPDLAIQNVSGFDGYTKTMSIDEKIAFWKQVMTYAHSRGFEFLFFNWNIWVSNADGKYGLKNGTVNSANTTYMYKCMVKLLETYPDLDGFGVTNGEENSTEEFLWDTYGKGMYDYALANPQRKLRFIHRWHQASTSSIKTTFSKLFTLPNVTFEMSYKYSKAHMYSTPVPTHFDKASDLIASKMKTWMTVRNDDFYYLHWGDPNYARAYINGFPGKGTYFAGFYMGSDGFAPTRSFFNKNSVSQGILEVQRLWYMNMLWGRLAYNPQTPDAVFKKYMAYKYSSASSDNLFSAWSKSSSGLPKVNELVHDSLDLDFKWYPEACLSFKGFVTVDQFAIAEVGPGSSLCNIPNSAGNKCATKKTSYQLADEIETDAKAALLATGSIGTTPNSELGVNVGNIKAMASLSIYYAYKIRGATYKKSGQSANMTSALGKGYCWWMNYTNQMDALYLGQKNQRTNDITPDWHFQDAAVLAEYTSNGGSGKPACDEIAAASILGSSKLDFRVGSLSSQFVSFNLPKDGAFTLSIFKTSGTKVKSIERLGGKSGMNKVSLGSELEKGIYFVTLKSEGQQITKRRFLVAR